MIQSSILRLSANILKKKLQDTNFNGIKQCRCLVRLLSSESSLPFQVDNSEIINIELTMSSLVHTLQKVGINFDNVSNISDNSVLIKANEQQILKNCSTLLEFGFDKNSVKTIIVVYPELFSIKNCELHKFLFMWLQIGFGGKLLIEMLSTNPQLIECMGHPNAKERIRILLSYLISFNNVGRLLINVPNVIYEDLENLKGKLDYLLMHNIHRNKIANCEALKLSLHKMKTRFTFLERAGYYKLEDEKKKTVSKNPTIKDILCTSDVIFSENVAKLTLTEFEVFNELFKLEQIDEEDENYGYNSE